MNTPHGSGLYRWKVSRLVLSGLIGILLTGCADVPPTSQPLPRSMMANCTARIVIHIRPGAILRGDFELIEAGRRAGVAMDIHQTLGYSTRMVTIRGAGMHEVCDEAIERLRRDPRIESIDNYF